MRKIDYYDRAGTLDPGLVARYYRIAGTVSRVLDVGCGEGCFGRLRPSTEIEVHGIDSDPIAIDRANAFETAVLADLDGGELPFPDSHFDAVFAKDILEHLREPLRIVREIGRVLQPGGVMIASVPMEYPRVVWGDYTHVRGFTRDALAGLLVDGGFKVRRVVPMGAVPGAGRLGLVDAIPLLLSVPGFRRLFGRSWEAIAQKHVPTNDSVRPAIGRSTTE